MTFVLNVVLLVAAFLSAQLALGWGEMGSFPMHGSKSALSGLGGVVLFMPLRWSLMALALWAGVARGGLGSSARSRRSQIALVLGAHLLLGVLAYEAFSWVVGGIQADDPGPQRIAIVFGLFVPVAVWLVAFVGVNRAWIPRRPVLAAVLVALMLWGNVAGWRQGYVRTPAAAAVTAK